MIHALLPFRHASERRYLMRSWNYPDYRQTQRTETPKPAPNLDHRQRALAIEGSVNSSFPEGGTIRRTPAEAMLYRHQP